MGRSVLVVDDDPDIRELVGFCMSAVGGWSVRQAAGGLEAVEDALQLRPDLVVLDVSMPVVDGIATFHLLQQHPSTEGVPVVLLTASQRVGRQAWDGLDVAGVITKPFDPITLCVQIDALVAAQVATRLSSPGARDPGTSPGADDRGERAGVVLPASVVRQVTT